ncbi:filamentous haemagglutinin family protein [Sphingomonas kyeonggiensis]|uniref:Filamentous hemagglutinin family protein n=1 Tax=Sphingomonas kyeonggiensis TaxID=1268553 RepID=A0A7W6JTJ0_9SPHN|nr:filamentous haemagglutinin family protein [Sphingomonas kyeonggiensis]MBB4099255.1 filamentous hemagglutinin family protein [Sphingomonas kyeonggiensis]
MTVRRSSSPFDARRHLLLLGASAATLALGLTSTPAAAQTMGSLLRQQAGAPRPQAQQPSAVPVRSPTMQAALSRQRSTQSRIAQIRAYASSLRQAATRTGVTDGLSSGGLDPTEAIREAIAATKAGDTERANQLLVSAGAANDPTGLKTWQGAGLPRQTLVDGRVVVTIDQTQERALLSWNRFDIGSNTTLQFNQKENGVAKPGWVAVNRVTNATDPSLILGNLKADGTVVVLNRSGIIFGKNSQVNTHSLLASTLDLGAAMVGIGPNARATTIRDRNTAYLEGGLFRDAPTNDPLSAVVLVSGVAGQGGNEGAVTVDSGAQLSSGTGGFLILAAPNITSSGTLRAVEGQVSLQAGREVAFVESTGGKGSADPDVRGYILTSGGADADLAGNVLVDGLIESRRGYLSLGTGMLGKITQNGLLSSSTSVSRNGKISLTGGTIVLGGSSDPARAAGLEIIADPNGEGIPQGTANEPAVFKASQIEIGTRVTLKATSDQPAPFAMLPTDFTMGENALIYAPGANVVVGATKDVGGLIGGTQAQFPGHVEIGRGATIDVSGYKDVQLDASRNSIEITPVKRNELRDTPNYREVALDGNFTLNGATLFVDPRLSGVRADGVAWVGSPLIEAGSLAGQIGVTAQELMTKGGSVSLLTSQLGGSATNPASVHIAQGATIDFSGGWVSYAGGTVRTSRLVTKDGRIVDIGKADPNDVYVGVVDGFTEVQPRFGVLRTYLSASGQGLRVDAAYDEGRDAGRLTIGDPAVINAPTVTIDGTFYGNAFAGARQIAAGDRPSLASTVAGDGRKLQRDAFELPSGGAVSIRSAGDILVYRGERGAAEANRGELLLRDGMLNDAGLSALSLTTLGAVTFAGANPFTLQTPDALRITGASDLVLAPGGALTVTAGRTIRFDGRVTANSGSIDARTVNLAGPGQASPGSAYRVGAYGSGNGDDLGTGGLLLYAADPGALHPFDVIVTGTLSTAGLWVNDYAEQGAPRGGAFSDGGSITLSAARNVFAAIGTSLETATQAVDLSGSVRVSGTLNVMSGGYVSTTGSLVLDGKGGNVSLSAATTYAAAGLTNSGRIVAESNPLADKPLGGTSQSVDFTPLPVGGLPFPGTPVLPQLVPDPRATVDIGSATILGYGFAGGGTFSLVAPDISFGSDNRAGATHIGLDFFRTTGFGTLDLSSYRSRIVDDVFTNARSGKSAFLETSQFVVKAGETLDLTQWLLPSVLSADQASALRGLASGTDLHGQSFLTPSRMEAPWDRKAAHLVLGGLTELDVLAGGTITGAPGASLTVSKLYNGGTIALHGGTITQRNDLPNDLVIGGLGVRGADMGGHGLADAFGGATDGLGRFDENALNAAGVRDHADPNRVITNRELVSREGSDRLIYFLGKLDAGQGILLDDGSVTDLSGIAIFNPRAPFQPGGAQVRVGRVLDGGSIALLAGKEASRRGSSAVVLSQSTLTRRDGAALDISGTSAYVDLATGLGNFTPYLEWSAAGSISALGGGSLGTTAIDAHGGTAQAEGGRLEWLLPTLGANAAGGSDYLYAGMIAASGFDSLIARNTLTLDGDFSLSLRKSLMVLSQAPTAVGAKFGSEVHVSATSGTDASIKAGYIRFGSDRAAALPGGTTGDARVDLLAGGQGIDVVGGVAFDRGIASVGLRSSGDVRLTGVNDLGVGQFAYSGRLVTAGDLLIDARRTYATTGTGNLQALLEGKTTNIDPFDIAALGDHSITFGNTYLDAKAPPPLSAGTHLRVLAARIAQNGYLAAPLGLLELGSNTAVNFSASATALATTTLTFGAGSVTTVSGAGLNVPYGSTSDLIEYYFPTIPTPITRLPTGQLNLAAASIVEEAGARVDGRGGGDVFAYEFQSGVGGSRDVLDRFNRDPFSSSGFDPLTGRGYQFADQRQVFALVPVSEANKIAPFDPLYSADYGRDGPVDLYGSSAGRTVKLDGAPGVPAGEYLLVPAKYAMAIPGALRLVENTGTGAPLPGQNTTLLDGSVIVGGTYGFAENAIAESTRRGFTVQTRDTFLKYSKIVTTSGSGTLVKNAADKGLARPRLPLDAARVILSPLTALRIAGTFDTSPAEGGQGGQFDLLGANVIIAADDSQQTAGALTVSAATLGRLGATSLLIGGQRADNANGTTAINASASSLVIRSGVTLDAPELLLAVGGIGSTLTIEDGVTLKASGALGTQPATDYTATTAGSLVRLANGAERLVSRTGTGASTLKIGAVNLNGGALALDTSGSFVVADAAALAAQKIAISGSAIQFNASADVAGQAGVIGAGLEAKLAAAQQLTVRSPGAIRFSQGSHRFNDLVLDTATLAASLGGAADGGITIDAGAVRLLNAGGATDGCVTAGLCGQAANLTINATTLSLGTNAVRTSGITAGVTLGARDGIYVEGKGSFSTGNAALTLRAPFLADRAAVADPRAQKVRPEYSFLTNAGFTLTAPAGAAAQSPIGNAAPGASISIGTKDAPVLSATIVGSLIRASAGIIDVESRGDITLSGATLSTPGYEKTFGDSVDAVTVSAGGGTINLLSKTGNLRADAASTLIVDNGVGTAGTLNLLAGNGTITLDATLNPGVQGNRQSSIAFDSGRSAFDLGGFVARYGRLFGGDVAVRSGAGDLALAAGQVLKAKSISLTADGGAITIGGTLDTSGMSIAGMTADQARNAAVDGGDIALWGRTGVTLAATAKLDTHTSGYADTDSRVASAGDVTIGIESPDAAITIARGAIIDVGARRTQAAQAAGETGARLVPQVITDAVTGNPITVYRYAAADEGGIVRFRAPVLGTNEDKVAVSLHGTVLGASEIQLEAFKRYDLDALANSGLYSGITRAADGTLLLDMAASSAAGGKFNPFTENFALADGGSSLVRFIQGFGVTTVDGSSLDGIRLRPGVELAADGSIRTTTQWNLGAATFSPAQLQAAVAAGVIEVIPELSTGGQAQYRVVPGKEGALLDRFATFLYRTGGSARGEAPVVTMRAGGSLTINRSISDGFFTFHDKSNASYINWQLGGGDRSYSPAIQFSCGGAAGSCGNIPSYASGAANNPGASGTLVIGLGSQAAQGDLNSGSAYVNSPLALAGNGAAGGGDAGDSLGFAELFPLLDGNTAMHSSDLRLVAGAGETLSVNPLVVDRALDADMIVAGQYSYRLTATGTVSFNGPLQFQLLQSAGSNAVNFDLGDTLDLTNATGGLNQLRDDAYTQLNWGNSAGLGADARAAARIYFAGKGYSFIGSATQPTGITAPLSEVLGFLKSFETTYMAGLTSGRTGYTGNRTPTIIRYGTAGQQNSPTAPNQAWVRSYVRTGDGAINVAAARDIDLRGAANLNDRNAVTYRKADGTSTTAADYGSSINASFDFSAAAIYTAGVRVAPVDVTARIAGGGLVTVRPDSPYLDAAPEKLNFIPSPLGLAEAPPVLAYGGGDIDLMAGRDVLGTRDVWSERVLGLANGTPLDPTIGEASQRWRVVSGQIGVDTEFALSPRYFTSGVGALAGGDVTIDAGRDVVELTVALTNGVSTTSGAAGPVMLSFGNGNLSIDAGRDILAGRFDVASGAGRIHAERDIGAFGLEPYTAALIGNKVPPQYGRVRLADAVVDISAKGSVTLASVSALGVNSSTQTPGAIGFFSPAAAIGISANEKIELAPRFFTLQSGPDYGLADSIQVLPPTVALTSLAGSVVLPAGTPHLLYPSPIGQLRLLSDGSIKDLSIAMSDADPGFTAGAFITPNPNAFAIPAVVSSTTNAQLRRQHNQRLTHAGDIEPVRIYSGGDIVNSAIFLPKQGRITAGGDIVDMFFNGQNLTAFDVTRIRAGGDITGTIASTPDLLPYVRSNNFILGGPGTLIVEAGGDIGPFVTSANITSPNGQQSASFGGGIRTIGNDYNPWLAETGADLQVRFGMAAGADYTALRETYLNPANFAKLDGDLFEQVTDTFGNQRPDRSRQIYAPLLAEWLRDNAPEAFAAIFGGQGFADAAALSQAAYGRADALYQAFAKVDPLRQQDFLINRLYFNEIEAVGVRNGPSFQQYVRGYRAIQTLFPANLGYTDNLAPYALDPSTISPDHPLGEPVRNIVNGQPQKAERIVTGNVDLRLATIQTARGGDVTILGPGGDVIAGSIVRTADQATRRATAFQLQTSFLERGLVNQIIGAQFASIPLGYEGVLTLRGGEIRSFTDGDFILNQSRVFTQQGGGIVMWSSNGDLNAGQGPKSASNFPPVTIRFDEDGLADVNSVGSVSGAGIGTFKRTPEDPASDVILIAPVGEVDAGDAGVRASGNVVVAAARVANADNFKAAGDVTGVPSQGVANVNVTPNGANEVQAQLRDATRSAQPPVDRRSIITVDVLGPARDGRCEDRNAGDDPDCAPGGDRQQ